MIADGTGGAIVVWTDAHRGQDDLYTGTFDLYASRILATGKLDPDWPQSGLAVCTAADDQLTPRVTSDRSGGAIVAWLDLRDGRHDIYAQHVLPRGVVDADWPTNGVPVCTAPPGDRGAPEIVTDGVGGAIIVWEDRRLATSDVYAQHLRRSGKIQPSWPENGRAICVEGGSQIDSRIAADGAGRAVITWRDNRSGDTDIYASTIQGRHTVPPGRAAATQAFELYPPQQEAADGGFTVRFVVPSTQSVSLVVFDATGRHARTLLTRQELSLGMHSFSFENVGNDGAPLKQGVYLIRLSAESGSLTRKFAILR